MQEITIEKVKDLAREWQQQGTIWHFHMLSPDCKFNEQKNKHALILENRGDNKTYVVYSKTRNMQLGRELVKMLHGDQIVREKPNKDPKIENEKIKVILKKAKALSDKNIAWHHHLFFSDCQFNQHLGQWVIVFEDIENNEVIEALYDHEPINDLKQIEVLYYKQVQ